MTIVVQYLENSASHSAALSHNDRCGRPPTCRSTPRAHKQRSLCAPLHHLTVTIVVMRLPHPAIVVWHNDRHGVLSQSEGAAPQPIETSACRYARGAGCGVPTPVGRCEELRSGQLKSCIHPPPISLDTCVCVGGGPPGQPPPTLASVS